MREMDQGRLIENVRCHEALYVTTSSKYTDFRYKENAWKDIGKKMKQPAASCKKTWTNLRDSFRRALKKKRRLRSGQIACKIKKWKYENEMTFLIPYLQERETCPNLGKDTDDNSDDENDEGSEDTNNDKNNDTGVKNDHDHANDDTVDPRVRDNNKIRRKRGMNNKKPGKKLTRSKGINKFDRKSAMNKCSTVIGNDRNANLLEECKKPNEAPNVIDTFFTSIATSVKNFSPYYQNIAKAQIFNIITDLEMKQIIQSQQEQFHSTNASMELSSNTPMPDTIPSGILESYHTATICDASHSSLSVSPAITATQSTSPSDSNFDCFAPTKHHSEQSVKIE